MNQRDTVGQRDTVAFSPYALYLREEWARLRADTPMPLSEAELENLSGLTEKISTEEVVEIYLPLSRLLNFYVEGAQRLHDATEGFLRKGVTAGTYTWTAYGSSEAKQLGPFPGTPYQAGAHTIAFVQTGATTTVTFRDMRDGTAKTLVVPAGRTFHAVAGERVLATDSAASGTVDLHWLTLEDGASLFAKSLDGAPAGFFETEAAGLRWLGEATAGGGAPAPEVIVALPELLALCERHDAWLLVDDAHGFGVLGEGGRGSLSHFGIASSRIAYMGTLGKAAGVHGAFVGLHCAAHHLAVGVARARRLAHPAAQFADLGTRRADDNGPVDLVGVAVAEGLAEEGRGARMAGEHEAARGVAVEPVHELRALLGVELQAVEQAIGDVAVRAAARPAQDQCSAADATLSHGPS